MKSLKAILIALFVILATISVAAQDKFQIGVDYGRTSLKFDFDDPLHDVNSIAVSALVRVAGAKKDGFKFRAGAEIRKTSNVEVLSDYPVPPLPDPIPASLPACQSVDSTGCKRDIYQDVYTYYGVAELAYRYKFLELGARAKLGAERILDYKFTRAYEFRGTLVAKHFAFTPLIIGFKREPQGFANYFGAGVGFRF